MGGKGHHPSSSESDDWEDESWIVDCPCGVNYDDGEEMVECDECGVWVHTACCRVPKGLPTYVCDKCKVKKKLKESEESEVAQLLAELPSKTISFDGRNHEKPEAYIAGYHNSTEIPIEERAHAHGIPGGDPSFFVGVSKVFCRQLWKYSGYVPKSLKVDYKELPERREDVVEFLRDVPDFEVPMSMDDGRKCTPVALQNGHATLALAEANNCRDEEVSNDEIQVHEEVLKDKQGKNVQVKKGEGRHSKHRHKPKVKDEKFHHQGKRVRDEAGLKEQSSKKKPRNNGDACKLDEGQWKEVNISASQEAGLLGKSPLSSPKNPKAMKKLAVQEFMDGDVILCKVCGKVEPLLDLITGASPAGRSESLCQECERVRGHTKLETVASKLETGTLKAEPVAPLVPSVINTGTTLEVRSESRKESDYCEAGIKAVRFRDEGNQASADGGRESNPATPGKDKICNDSSSNSKKFDVDVTDSHKSVGMHENVKVRDEKQSPPIKVVPNVLQAWEISEDVAFKAQTKQAPESPVVKNSATFQAHAESALRAEGLGSDARLWVTKPSCTDVGDSKMVVCGNKEVVSADEYLPAISSDNLESSSKPAQVHRECFPIGPAVPSSNGPISPGAADGNGTTTSVILDKVPSTIVADTVEVKASKTPASSMGMETKSQGSARTAGHLPASVRGKMHGERYSQQLQRLVSSAGGQQQAHSLSGQSPVQASLSGPQRSVRTAGMVSSPRTKGSSGEDPVLEKQHDLVQVDGISPVPVASKQSQQVQFQMAQTAVAHNLTKQFSETSSPSRPYSSGQLDQQLRSKGQSDLLVEPNYNEFFTLAVSPKQPEVVSRSKPLSPVPVLPTQGLCQQARQLNGIGHIGHVYTSRSKSALRPVPVSTNCTSINPIGSTLTSQVPKTPMNNLKVSANSLKSPPSSGTSSSSPTSPLVNTPSSKPQTTSVKVLESPTLQKSLSGGSTPNASVPQSSSKVSGSITSTTSGSKQVGSLHSAKSVPSHPASPQSSKVASMSKQSSRSTSLPATKGVDGSNSGAMTTTGVGHSRSGNHSGSSLGGSVKESVKTVTHASSKTATTGKASAQPAVTKPLSSVKSSHSHVPVKGSSSGRQHSGPGSASSKASTVLHTTKSAATHHNKSGTSHKEEKSSMPPAPPVPKAMSTMPPPAPHVSTKRSPPTVLASAAATTLKDEELALLLHQELNSSPRVPRVPRVRSSGASLQLVSSPSLSSAKGSFASVASGGSSHKDHHPALRKRTREDRSKESSKSISQSFDEVGKSGGNRAEENKVEDGKVPVEKVGHGGTTDGGTSKEKLGVPGAEGNARHHGFAKGNLSIIVPGNDDTVDGDKKSPADGSVVTLPGLIDEVLSNRGHQLSYEDVCEAVLPHWPKLRKPNGERYAYASHKQAVLDCLRNRSAWAHLVGRGPKTNAGRKRRRNESTTLSDTDEEENDHLGFRDSDVLDTSKSSKRRKEFDGEKWDSSDRQKKLEDDVPKGKRIVRRRRRVAIEDGTDGEDEPTDIVERGSGQPVVSKSGGGTSQEEELDAESSPSSEEAVSNYSEEDEEMVEHRGIRNRRRPADDSSGSEDDID